MWGAIIAYGSFGEITHRRNLYEAGQVTKYLFNNDPQGREFSTRQSESPEAVRAIQGISGDGACYRSHQIPVRYSYA